ncbi:M protein trans-acting positive regulator [Enterococcus casseliflavus]|uniref:helix-turn-helix domain-containing protein n=2 Tax=Enterococcus casseliflavus TaxID=37734 RepID=UPI001C8BDE3A|nr:helix-turn-helix domain-containing protein [Enterococcus casseliflavus]MBX9117669.1 M protein trans-acting positive regulator [Enterococcus casseliflavus]MBX9128226.1 M protein trans-acting positive regulator [Enterococcus casseliflavus]
MIPNYLRREFHVLFFTINKKETRTEEISFNLKISKRAVRETIKTINEHFEELMKITDFVVSSRNGNIKIREEYWDCAISLAYTLKLLLLKKNIAFNYTILLVTRVSLTKKEILEELFISPSYLNKITKKLNIFFSSFDFYILNENGQYRLAGNEFNIRLFSCIFLQDSFQDIEWPFSDVSNASIPSFLPDKLLNTTYSESSTQGQLKDIFFAVLQTRINNKQYLFSPKSKLIQSFFSIISENISGLLFRKDNRFFFLEKVDEICEADYFYFMSLFFIPDIISKESKINLGQIFIDSKHPFCFLSREILGVSTSIFQKKMSTHEQNLFIYYLTLFNALYALVGESIMDFTKLFIPPLTYHSDINDEYINELQKSIAPFNLSKSHNYLLVSLLHVLFISELKTEIKIYLRMSKDFMAGFFIERKLKGLFNENQIIITEDYSVADIVVTDTLERAICDKKVFYLDSISNMDSWRKLLSLIQHSYLDKQMMQKV